MARMHWPVPGRPTADPAATRDCRTGLRFLCDDIKAMYSEAAQADGRPPSSRQIDAWFWSETIAGRLLIALRSMALQSENNALRTVGGRFFVPAQYLSVNC
jgi:hypothetical protein